MDLFIVYSGVWGNHYTSETLFTYLDTLRPGQVINDRAAQTIASWWHDGRNTLSLVLSGSGKVDRRMSRETFASDADYAATDQEDRRALDALSAYIASKISTAESSYRPCACRDCFDTAIGIIGALCPECTEAECTFGEGDDCQRADAYGM